MGAKDFKDWDPSGKLQRKCNHHVDGLVSLPVVDLDKTATGSETEYFVCRGGSCSCTVLYAVSLFNVQNVHLRKRGTTGGGKRIQALCQRYSLYQKLQSPANSAFLTSYLNSVILDETKNSNPIRRANGSISPTSRTVPHPRLPSLSDNLQTLWVHR